MKKIHFIITTLTTIFCSCAGNSVLLDTESDLNNLISEYELAKSETVDELKKETVGDKDSIQMLQDNYVAEIMGRLEVAKEKVMRTAYSASSPRVGVFKTGTCGHYKTLSLAIDCENGRSKTRVEGNVGNCFVDGNDNMHLEFCLVEASFRYPGGVFLIEDAPAHTPVTTRFIVVRHHDTEDGGHQSLWSDDPKYADGDLSRISGMSKLDYNATLAWEFNRNMHAWDPEGEILIGPDVINYGVLSFSDMASGNLYFDDEDHNNKNWAQYWINNKLQYHVTQSSFYGIELGINTRYYVCFSNDRDNFKKLVKKSMGF